MTKRLLITGARAWTDRARLEEVLDVARAELGGDIILVSGNARQGADRMAESWAEDRDVAIERHPANWDEYGKRAGFVRNAEMVKLGADGVVAFIAGESRGTRHTVRLAREAGLKVHVVDEHDDADDDEAGIEIEEMPAYAWHCRRCDGRGPLEISEGMAQDGASSHRCRPPMGGA